MAKEGDSSDSGAEVPNPTVTEIPEKTAHRQRVRRDSGASLGPGSLPRVDEGHYELKGEVARGGIGRIVAAFDHRLEREVALKELVAEHPVSEVRFVREAKLTARLQHPAIIPVHDAAVWPSGRPFYAMKLVEGRSLAGAIEATQTYAERIALLGHVVDVAEAIAYAHSQRIIHRDLKPSNVLVGAFAETVVIDWGLAKDLERPHRADDIPSEESAPAGEYQTSEGAVLGTPAYMPPEQATGGNVDERADVYALGAMLYHLLAGRRPYYDVPSPELLDVVGHEPPLAIEELEPEVPPDLAAIVTKAMARQPDERYRDAGELADELRRFTTGQLVGAYRYSSRDLVVRFYRKYRRFLLMGAVFGAILLTYGAWSVVRIASERNRAESAARSEQRLRKEAETAARTEVELREQAQATARGLLVSQARLLLITDPTEAVATLKELDGPVAGVASIVAEAVELGVARRVMSGEQPAQVRAVAVDRAGAVVAWSDDAGHVMVQRGDQVSTYELHGDERVPALAMSSDGAVLVSGGYDGRLLSLDTRSGASRVVGQVPGAVLAVDLAPSGEAVAALSSEGRVTIWPMGGGEARDWKTAVGRAGFLRYSPDGRWLASGSHGNDVLLLDVASDRARYLRGHRAPVAGLAFAPDGAELVTGSEDGEVRLWSVTGAGSRVLSKHAAGVTAVAMSGDGLFVASGDMNGDVRLATRSSSQGRVLGRHEERVTSVAFAHGGDTVVSVSWDKTARAFSTAGGASRVLRGHDDVISSLAVSGDGQFLVTGSWDTTVRVWPAVVGERRVLQGHEVGVKTVAFSPDGSWIASGAHDDSVRLWDLESGRSRVFSGHRDHVFRVAFSPDGRWLASSSDDRTVRLWDLDGDRHRVLTGHQADVEELVWAPSSEVLVSGAEDDTARLWRVRGGTERVLSGHDRPVSDVGVSPDGTVVVTASLDGTLRLWTLDDDEPPRILRGHDGEVLRVGYGPSGRYILSLGRDETLRRWPHDGGESSILGAELTGARALAISPTGAWAAVGGARGDLWLCAVREPAPCRAFRGHLGTIWRVAFSPDGRVLATAGADNTVRLWDVESGEHRVLYGHAAPVFDVAFAPDGKRVVSGSGDGDVRVWTVELPPPVQSFDRSLLDRLTDYELAR